MIIFLDLETTGLEPSYHTILEVAARLWPGDSYDSFQCIVQLRPGDYQRADDFVQDMHERNGLWLCCSEASCSLDDAAVALERWLRCLKRAYPNELLTLAGNSIHFDRAFLKVQMPYVEQLFHYRMIDVSSLHLAAEALGFARAPEPEAVAHRAMADVDDSIRQFEFYRRFAEKLEVS